MRYFDSKGSSLERVQGQLSFPELLLFDLCSWGERGCKEVKAQRHSLKLVLIITPLQVAVWQALQALQHKPARVYQPRLKEVRAIRSPATHTQNDPFSLQEVRVGSQPKEGKVSSERGGLRSLVNQFFPDQ